MDNPNVSDSLSNETPPNRDARRVVPGRPFQPGQSGNPAGRPIGSRQKLDGDFVPALHAKWKQRGDAALDDLTSAEFVRTLVAVLPKDVSLTVTQRVPGGLDPDDWSIALEVFAAIKQALPEASQRQPGEVLQFVLEAIRAADAKLIEPA